MFEGATWFVALREFRKAKGDLGYFEAMRRSKDPPTFIVLFEDSAAMIGLLIAFIGTFAADTYNMPVLDGVASIGISLVLAATAFVLGRESKGLLMGEPASRALRDSIGTIARGIDGIERAQVVLTVHMAPDQVVVALNVEFRDSLTAPQIEQVVNAIERAVHREHPQILTIFIKPETTTAQLAQLITRPGAA